MNKIRLINFIAFLWLAFQLSACNSASESNVPQNEALPEVEVAHPHLGTIQDSVELSAEVNFRNKNTITAPVNSYVKEINIQPGDYVKKGQKIFTLTTKEARVLSQTELGQGLGTLELKASSDGQVTSINYFSGDYVQEGSTLAEIIKPSDVYLKVYVPYVYSEAIQKNKKLKIWMETSGEWAYATIQGALSIADISTQSAVYIAKLDTRQTLPEGMILTSYLITESHSQTLIIPSSAVLANEELTSFWVMKIGKDSLAVKVPVERGIYTDTETELLNPPFDITAQIITSGQYGMDDSTRVQIQGMK